MEKNISRLTLGTVKFGRNTGVKYPKGFELPTNAEIESLLDLCLENGITALDTAPAYGTSEERLGTLLKHRRDKFFLMTKTGEEFDGEKSQHIFTAAHTRMSIERSLKRLRTERLDGVLVHSNHDDLGTINNTDVLETLAKLKQEGKIGLIGVSTYTVEGGKRAIDLTDAAMVAYNSDYRAEEDVIAYAAAKGKKIFVKKGLASGHTADVDASIRFVLNTKGVTSLVFGSLSPENVLKNVRASETC